MMKNSFSIITMNNINSTRAIVVDNKMITIKILPFYVRRRFLCSLISALVIFTFTDGFCFE
eukprot:Pgem_evm1s10214